MFYNLLDFVQMHQLQTVVLDVANQVTFGFHVKCERVYEVDHFIGVLELNPF